MANLLSRKAPREPFPELDPDHLARFETRLRSLAIVSESQDSLRGLERSLVEFEPLLDELESAPSPAPAFGLLDGIERARQAVSTETEERDGRCPATAPSPSSALRGDLICYWPGRSLSTGEANIASRGFFDVLDRPPIGFWLETIARPIGSARGEFEIAIIAWIPPGEFARAEAGRQACTSQSLALLSETSPTLTRQLRPILDGHTTP